MQILRINRKNKKPVSAYVLSGFIVILTVLVAACPMLTAPPAMYAPTLIEGSEQLTASWIDPTTWNWGENNAGNDITAYNLRYGEVGSENWTEITSGITGASHTITGLTNGVNYAVQVRAVNAQGTGGWSASSTATPIAPPTVVPPAAPGTMATPTLYAGPEQLVATWTVPTDNGGSEITAYHLRHREDGSGSWEIITEGIDGTSTSHVISDLINGAIYQVQTRAVNAVGAGDWSEIAMKTPTDSVTQTPGEEVTITLSYAFNAIVTAIIANENLSVSLTTVEPGTLTIEGGDLKVTPATPPGTVTIPTVDTTTGIVTVTASTTAGTYVVYGETGSGDIVFAEYLYVTVSPTTNALLKTAVTDGISTWGNTGNFNYIITTAVTDMSTVFKSKTAFNGDISGWDVSSVANMYEMFRATNAFNGDVSRWDVSSVMNMGYMFYGISVFNGDISGWDVSSVTNMDEMFRIALAFNQNLEEWKDHWTLDANGKYTGSKQNVFGGSGVTGSLVPSWY